jgi:hypothetical protein
MHYWIQKETVAYDSSSVNRPDDGKSKKEPANLCVIHYRQDPLSLKIFNVKVGCTVLRGADKLRITYVAYFV